jgi:phosphomannomutase
VGALLSAAGFRVAEVPEEAEPDGRFAAVPFRAPNPEVRESMERAVRVAGARGAELVMACDPDADRIGICARAADGAIASSRATRSRRSSRTTSSRSSRRSGACRGGRC